MSYLYTRCTTGTFKAKCLLIFFLIDTGFNQKEVFFSFYVNFHVFQVVVNANKAFTFDYVFDSSVSQATVYKTSVAPLIDGIFKGLNLLLW